MPSDISKKVTVGVVLGDWIHKFAESSVPEPELSAERIVAHVLSNGQNGDIFNKTSNTISEDELLQIQGLCTKRLQRMPISYVLQQHKFRGLSLKMTPPVFIPWPETENLIDVALEVIDMKKPKVVIELCVGSGAISLAILKARPELKIIGVDRSEDACKLTRENADALNLSNRIEIIHSEISENGDVDGIDGQFDVIISNPPYVPLNDIEGLGTEFTGYQDRRAVESGLHGMDMITVVLKSASRLLNPDGRMVLEVNPTHPPLIQKLLKDNLQLGISFVRALRDANSLYRYVEVVKN